MKRLILVLGAMLLFVCCWAQQRTVTGKVTSSEDGTPLPGVNVIAQGSTEGTVTGTDGTYSLTLDGDRVLVFSFIGLQSAEVAMGGRTVIDVQLAADTKQLTEVVVVGYGSQLKQDLTGNIA